MSHFGRGAYGGNRGGYGGNATGGSNGKVRAVVCGILFDDFLLMLQRMVVDFPVDTMRHSTLEIKRLVAFLVGEQDWQIHR